MPLYFQALLWGLLAGAALVIGAALASVPRISPRVLAAVTAFGAGVLISALSFELVDEAHRRGGILPTAIGFLAGAAAFTAANLWISRRGGHGRTRSGHQQQKAHESAGLAIAVGALFDGIPESVAIGVSLLADQHMTFVTVAATSWPICRRASPARLACARPAARTPIFSGYGAALLCRAASPP
jgi:ZIP family zinc transporter